MGSDALTVALTNMSSAYWSTAKARRDVRMGNVTRDMLFPDTIKGGTVSLGEDIVTRDVL